jgi:hypothetical protein
MKGFLALAETTLRIAVKLVAVTAAGTVAFIAAITRRR